MPSSLFGPKPQSQPVTQNSPPNNTVFQPPANLNQLKGLMSLMQNGGNVNGMIQTLIQNSPQANTIFGYLSKHNGDARAAFYDMAKEKGVDPNQVLNMLK